MSDVDAVRSLGTVGGVEFAIAQTQEPWTLKVDALIVSVGESLGSLASAVRSYLPDAGWESVDLSTIRPDRPNLLQTRRPNTEPLAIILATVHSSPDQTPSPDEALAMIPTTVGTSLTFAGRLKLRRVVLPLFGAGRLHIHTGDAAATVVGAALDAIEGWGAAQLPSMVAFLADSDGTAAQIEDAWRLLATRERTATPAEPQDEHPSSTAEPPGTAEPDTLAGGVHADLVDPDLGIPREKDDLGVSAYVSMLATAIATKDTRLPLSIGLFGEWGSGKSYFMGLLRSQVAALNGSGDAYCAGIEQIGFNAWTYADTNLWASLGDEIFRSLAEPAEDEAAPDSERRAQIRERLEKSQACATELRAAKEEATRAVGRLRGELQQRRGQRTASAWALARATVAAATQDESLARALGDAWGKLGVSTEAEQVRLLAAEVEGVDRTVGRSRPLLTRGAQYVAAAVAAVGLVLLIVGLAASGVLSGWLAGSGAATVAAALATLTVVTRKVNEGLATVSRLAQDIRRRREAIGAEQVEAARKALDEAEAREQVLQTELDETLARVGELDRELTDLSPGRRVYSFLAERSASDDYRRQMGLVAMIRRDFEQLARLMRSWRADEQTEVQPIDRIVLYIDDLDRCTPRQVVDVLQAVHLLLALDLFVVVVGVDPRWLLHSLHDQYRTLLTELPEPDPQPGAGNFLSTPHDYLEKIFNVPFVLPAMTTTGFETMIRRLSVPDASSGSTSAHPGTVDRPPIEPEITGGPVLPEPAGVVGPEVEEGSEIDQVRRGVAVPPAPMRESELTLLAALAPLVRSPREAKRLLNLYRMLRSTKDLSDAARFLGPRSADGSYPDGEYQAVAVLLGILAASPYLLGRLLFSPADPARGIRGGICVRASDQNVHSLVEGLHPRRDANQWVNDLDDDLSDPERLEWTTMVTRLAPALRLVHLADLTAFRSWGPHVARFSFLLAVPSTDDAAPSSRVASGAAVAQARAG